MQMETLLLMHFLDISSLDMSQISYDLHVLKKTFATWQRFATFLLQFWSKLMMSEVATHTQCGRLRLAWTSMG